MLARLRSLYEGDDADARRFRYGLLLFDMATVLFIVVTSFIERRGTVLEVADVAIGTVILADFLARLAVSRDRLRDLVRPSTLADVVAVASFLAPIAGEAGGFLRILRTLRLLRTYHVAESIRHDFPFYRRHEEVIVAVINLAVFLFVMTGIVYETQHWSNPDIRNYADALYFTVTALTTTGFGDITLAGTVGRMISVLIMIFAPPSTSGTAESLLMYDSFEYRFGARSALYTSS